MGLGELGENQGGIMKGKLLLRERRRDMKMKEKNKEEKQGRETRTN